MNLNPVRRTAAALVVCAAILSLTPSARAINNSIPAIGGDVSRQLLGDGTGVIIGIVDSGVDVFHPTFGGLDSQDNPRLVAQANYVTTEPGNTGDDVFGHGTWVASVALGSDPVYTGLAPDARLINARVLDSNAGFNNDAQVRNGIGFAIEQGADVLNLSLNYFIANSSGFSQLDLMIDWAASARGISTAIAAGNISGGNGTSAVRGPGSAYNGVTAGRTIADLSKVSIDSAGAFTFDGRMKPDIVAPGTLLTVANDDWETGPLWDFGLNGTSFAAPHIVGLMAQQIEAGRTHSLSTSPLVVKASLLNSADKRVLDRDFNPWEPGNLQHVAGVATVTQPLDTHSGVGLADAAALAKQYLAGEMGPGLVDPIGWDLGSIAHGEAVDYAIAPPLAPGSTLTATLTWFRHVGRTDNGNGMIDAGDSFFVLRTLSDLNLQILRDGVLVAESASAVDNVEHLHISVDQSAHYTLRVAGLQVIGGEDEFALAWWGVAVPEPASLSLLLLAATGLAGRHSRFRSTSQRSTAGAGAA